MRCSALCLLVFLLATFGQLNKVAQARELKYFGIATDNWVLENSTYYRIGSYYDEFEQITVAEAQKRGNVEAVEGRYTYQNDYDIANLAKNDGQLLRCHNMLWCLNPLSWGIA
jgi:endo-1,4-beta-xylanase